MKFVDVLVVVAVYLNVNIGLVVIEKRNVLVLKLLLHIVLCKVGCTCFYFLHLNLYWPPICEGQ